MRPLSYEELRRDRSATVSFSGSDTALISGRPVFRTSEFRRHFDPGSWIWRSQLKRDARAPEDAPSVPELSAAAAEVWADLSRAVGPGARIACSGVLQRRARHYQNSEGCRWTTESLWCQVHVSLTCLDRIEFVTDGCSTDNAGGLLTSAVEELLARFADGRLDASAAPVGLTDLVLSPAVAGVVFHELIGHGSEPAARPEQGLRVGPPMLSVDAFVPDGAGFDDEGIPTRSVPLVRGGRMVGGIADRALATATGAQPSGMARAGTHAGAPHVRCAALVVAGGDQPFEALIDRVPRGAFCTGVGGGDLCGDQAIVSVSAARSIRRGKLSRRVPPFRFVVPLRRLYAHLGAIADDVGAGRSAVCVSHGDSLPALTRAPTIHLQQVRIAT